VVGGAGGGECGGGAGWGVVGREIEEGDGRQVAPYGTVLRVEIISLGLRSDTM
jgi:hypothetical protein